MTTIVGRLALLSLIGISSYSLMQFMHVPEPAWTIAILLFGGVFLLVELGALRWPGFCISLPMALAVLYVGHSVEAEWFQVASLVWEDLQLLLRQLQDGTLETIPAYAGYALIALWVGSLAALATSGQSNKPLTGALFLCIMTLFLIEWLYRTPNVELYVWYAAASGLLWLSLRHGYHGSRTWAACLSVGLIMAIAWWLPKPSEAVSQGNLEQRLNQTAPLLAELRNRTTYLGPAANPFHLGTTGFARDESALGGPVMLDPTPILELHANDPIQTVLYLRGGSKTTYNSRGWVTPDMDRLGRSRLFQGSSGTWRLNRVSTRRSGSRLEIRLLQPSRTVFYPQGLLAFRLPEGHVPDLLPGDVIVTDEIMPTDSRYVVFRQPELQYIAEEESLAPSEEQLYLQLPSTLPDSVRQLGDDLASQSRGALEFARTVQDYLRQNYTYTLTPSIPPVDVDFVHHFLFEEKQGYCTYFASAMTVLLRTQGVPARWVTGFRVDPLDPSRSSSEGRVIVRNQDAHAWVEAWIPPYGWLLFDPTPAGLPEGSQAALTPLPTEEQLPQSGLDDDSLSLEDEGLPEQAESSSTEQSLPFASVSGQRFVHLVVGLLAAALLAAGAIWFLHRAAIRQRERLMQLGGPAAAQAAMELMEHFGKKHSIVRRPHETPSEYVMRLGRATPDKHALLERLCRWLERQAYGSPELRSTALSEGLEVWRQIQQSSGKKAT